MQEDIIYPPKLPQFDRPAQNARVQSGAESPRAPDIVELELPSKRYRQLHNYRYKNVAQTAWRQIRTPYLHLPSKYPRESHRFRNAGRSYAGEEGLRERLAGSCREGAARRATGMNNVSGLTYRIHNLSNTSLSEPSGRIKGARVLYHGTTSASGGRRWRQWREIQGRQRVLGAWNAWFP